MLAPLPNDNELLELVFAQSIAGFFVMLLDEPIDWAGAPDRDALLDHVFRHQRITKVNAALLRQYGASESELLGATPRVLQRVGGSPTWRRPWARRYR